MTLWDGLTSANSSGVPSRIMVLGATNRIHDIDEAILRRMPKKFPVPLPGKDQRRRILQLVLGDTKRHPDFDLEYIARVTAGMSGSDLKEACRDAAMVPMREYIRSRKESGDLVSRAEPAKVRGIRTDDFFGRKGASHAIDVNRAREQLNQKEKEPKRVGTSSDEYEDVEDDPPVVSPS